MHKDVTFLKTIEILKRQRLNAKLENKLASLEDSLNHYEEILKN